MVTSNGASAAEQMLSMLLQPTQEDLDALDARAEKLRGELEVVDLLRKMLLPRLKGLPEGPAKPPAAEVFSPVEEPLPAKGAITKASVTDVYRRRAVKYLAEHGCTPAMALAKHCAIPNGSMSSVLAHPWFNRTQEGVLITPVARRDLL